MTGCQLTSFRLAFSILEYLVHTYLEQIHGHTQSYGETRSSIYTHFTASDSVHMISLEVMHKLVEDEFEHAVLIALALE